jgi:hypothetical protein
MVLAGLGAVAAMGGMASGAAQTLGAATPAIGNIQVKAISVTEIDTSHVKVAVDLILTPMQSATLEDMRLCSLRLNGMPVFAEPLRQQIVLRKGVAMALPPLYVTALYRDLYTVEPLRKMIEDQNVHVQGELDATVQLSFMEKLALHTQHPSVEMPLSQDVAAEVGSSALERNLALTMLSVFDTGLQAKAKADKYIPGARPAWIDDLDARAQGNLYEVASSYALLRGEESYPVELDQLGFRLGTGNVVTTAAVREPWRYDAEFLGAVKSGKAKLDKKSEEIQLWPMGASQAPLKLSARDFGLETHGNPEDASISVVDPSYGKILILKRASPTTLAVLVLQTPALTPGLAVAPAAVLALDSWDQVAVFRLRENPVTKARTVEVLRLGARRGDEGIELTEPVDSAVFGSPIVTPDGVIGIVQDEQSGAFLPASLVAPVVAAEAAH